MKEVVKKNWKTWLVFAAGNAAGYYGGPMASEAAVKLLAALGLS